MIFTSGAMLAALLPIAAKFAAKGIGKLAANLTGSPVAEQVAGPIVEGVFQKLGVDVSNVSTPDQLSDFADTVLSTHPEEIGQAVNEITNANKDEWVALWRIQTEQINLTMRAEIESENWLSRSWRPIFGLCFSAIYVILGVAFAYVMFSQASPVAALEQMSTQIMAYVGSGAAVLGVQVWSRGEEKRKGVA